MIGNAELIGKRDQKAVSIPPGGVLSDYIPFYFTPHSPMLLNIKGGRNGVTMRPMSEIVILVTSLHKVLEQGAKFVFTSRHAAVLNPEFFADLEDLDRVDWRLLRSRDFKRDEDDPDKLLRYQAEALIHKYLPVSALTEVACYSRTEQGKLQKEAKNLGVTVPIVVRPDYFFQ